MPVFPDLGRKITFECGEIMKEMCEVCGILILYLLLGSGLPLVYKSLCYLLQGRDAIISCAQLLSGI